MASASDVRVYTAFGELIDPGMNGLSRYGYAGAFGYEKFAMSELDDPSMTPNPADTVFPFLHVGARWYDPATGRFLQRDPNGIDGGVNVYSYGFNTPTIGVDPDGEIFFIIIVAVTVIVLDEAAQYANAPAPGDSTFRGGPGGSGASVIAGGAAEAALARGAGYAARMERYRRGGGGINVYRRGKRVFGMDCHRLPSRLGGKFRPHYHRPPNMQLHRPFEGF